MSEQAQPLAVQFDDEMLIGRVLKDVYHVDERLGEGGMACVYGATHTLLGGRVAIKFLLKGQTSAQDRLLHQRFLREAQIQNRLSHPNIVRVTDVLQEDQLSGFVMEWCNGGDLQEWLERLGRPLTITQLQLLFVPIVDALGYAHTQGVIHRDLKAPNILLHHSGETTIPKLTDFGIAKMIQSTALTQPGEAMGTLEYAAPEQLQDSKSADERADIYSLGVLLYRMCTGALPFTGSPSSVVKQVLQVTPKRPEQLPEALADVIMRCMEKRPEDRYPGCQALMDAFAIATALARPAESLQALPAVAPDTEEFDESPEEALITQPAAMLPVAAESVRTNGYDTTAEAPVPSHSKAFAFLDGDSFADGTQLTQETTDQRPKWVIGAGIAVVLVVLSLAWLLYHHFT